MPLSSPLFPRRSSLILLASLSLLCACSELENLRVDKTELVRGQGRFLGRRLIVRVAGQSPEVQKNVYEAFRAELEDGDLFHRIRQVDERQPEEADDRQASLLTLRVLEVQRHDFGNLFTDSEGWLVKYVMQVELLDRNRLSQFKGVLNGIAYDDTSERDRLDFEKREDILRAAERDAASKLGDALRAQLEQQLEIELERIPSLRFAAGVGPLKLALVNIDLKRAHPSTRASEIQTEILSAFEQAGPELEISSPRETDDLLERRGITNMSGLVLAKKTGEEMEYILPARVVVMVVVRARASVVQLEASLYELNGGAKLLGQSSVRAGGLGAMRLASVRLVRKLVRTLRKTRFQVVASPG